MTQIEAMKEALEASKDLCTEFALEEVRKILESAIAEAEKKIPRVIIDASAPVVIDYNTQPKQEWVGLTDEEIEDVFCDVADGDYLKTGRLIEAKLKYKNSN